MMLNVYYRGAGAQVQFNHTCIQTTCMRFKNANTICCNTQNGAKMPFLVGVLLFNHQ